MDWRQCCRSRPAGSLVVLATLLSSRPQRSLTTNFDGCVVDALSALAPYVPRPVEINQTPDDHVSFSVYGHEPMLV